MNAYFFSKTYIVAALLSVAAVSLRAQIQLNVEAKNPTCNGYTNGEATATASNGTAPYTFKWSNGVTGSALYSLTGGTFTVTVTDAANQTASKSVTVSAPAPLVASAAPQGGACDTSVNWFASATGGTAPYKFTWLDFKTNQNTEGVSLIKPSRGSYFLQVTDANGCTANKVIEVTGNLSVTLKLVDATCGGTCDGAAEAIVTGGKEPYSYKWNFKDMTGPVLFPIPGGDYSVTVTDANGCVKEAKGFVFEPEILKSNLRIENVCSDNGSATVSPTGGRAPYTVKWSNGATGFNVQNLKTGQYFVTVSDAFGCNIDGQINISKPSLDLVLTKTDASCAGVSNGEIVTHVKGGSLGPYKYDWSNGGANDFTLKNVAAGNYRLTVTDGAGCKDSTQIAVNNLKTLSLATSFVNSVCGDVKTGGVSVNNVINGVGPFTFQWSNDAKTQNITGVGAGRYVVTVTDGEGCRAVSNPIDVIEEATAFNIVPTITDATCGRNNGTISLAVTGGVAPYRFSRPLNDLAAGDYTVIVTDAKGCSAAQTLKVGGKAGLKADFAISPMNCEGDSVQYKFSSTSTGDLTGATYTWLFGTNRTLTGANQELRFGNLNEEARLIVRNTEGCTDTVKKPFQVNTLNVSVPKTCCMRWHTRFDSCQK
ncbi:MAG: hypothetical protein HC817_04775 [Saprospiraceae bacterium]|nr:hypothetical protein [Saprospiraceae bacterium]